VAGATQPPVRRDGRTRRAPQRGISLVGLLFWAMLIGFAGYVAVQVLPTVNEYLTIQRAVDKIAAERPPTVPEVRAAFERQKEIEYAIQSIAGSDLQITKENDRLVIAYRYERELHLLGPAYLLLKYEGRSK
jgi:Domain of unknown function (DUF4845)